jgi:hypothetical protein
MADAPVPSSPLVPQWDAPFTAYRERHSRAVLEKAALDRRSSRIADARALTFITAVVLVGLTFWGKLPRWGYWASAGSAVAYAALATWHHRVSRREAAAALRETFNVRGLSRCAGLWRGFPEDGSRFAAAEHLYAADLDLYGQGSLFQLLNETATRWGEDALARTLAAPPQDTQQTAARQGALRELSPRVDFRQELHVEARLASRDKADPAQFIAWAEGKSPLEGIRWALPLASLLPVLTLTLFVLGRFDVVPRASFWAGLFLHLGLAFLTRKALSQTYEQISMGERGFVRFERVFARVESEPLQHPLLGSLGVRPEGGLASEHLRAFSRRFAFAEVRQSGQLHAVLHFLTLWDLHAMFALDRWRKAHGARVRGWFEALAQLEALCALATFAHDRPDCPYPLVVDQSSGGGTRLVASDLGHPLLDRPVLNDVSLPGPGAALVVTGSNMAGKTTLLRAMGVNTVLALAGAPVCAKTLEVTPLQIVTSMRVKDSLERGVSYFYAEVQRIKTVLDAATSAQGRALFLLDEILLGTNTRERQIASQEVLRALLRTGAIGAVATHDLALTSLAAEQQGRVANVHFREQVEDGKMTFDYRLRTGVVDSTNALKLLRLAGIPIQEG